ncbi:MAG TPA: hypothetical protein VGL40_11830 [Bacillota bacterium]
MTSRVQLVAQFRAVQEVDSQPSLSRLISFLKIHPDFLESLLDVVFKIKTMANFASEWPGHKKRLRGSVLPNSEKQYLQDFLRLVEQLYDSPHGQRDLSEDDYLGRLRGRLAERLVIDPLSSRFAGDGCQFADNPLVKIDGKTVKHKGKSTIDVGGIKEGPKSGVLLEVKVSPSLFSTDCCDYLALLKAEITAIGFDTEVGGITLASKGVFETGGPFSGLRRSYAQLSWLAREDIPELRFDVRRLA